MDDTDDPSILAFTPLDDILAFTPLDDILAFTPLDDILAFTPLDDILAFTPLDDILAFTPLDDIFTAGYLSMENYMLTILFLMQISSTLKVPRLPFLQI